MTELALEILSAAVRESVGARAEPRPGQVAATLHIAKAINTNTHASVVAPTGSGKSFALLSVAAWRVAEYNERVLVSTESLSLQKQYVEKDAPSVQAAMVTLGYDSPGVAVLKGTSNYLDPRRLTATAALLLRRDERHTKLDELIRDVKGVTLTSVPLSELDGADPKKLRDLVVWGLEQYQDPALPGDRHSCTLPVTNLEWAHVSAASNEAAGPEDHWLLPKAHLAKERVAEADIVIVNHTLLAIQAANGVPVVLGNSTYGEFHHILVDEAHTLPDEVRSQGAAEVSGRAVHRVMRSVKKVADRIEKWSGDGDVLAQALDTRLRSRLGRETTVRLPQDENPIEAIEPALASWLSTASRLIKPALESRDVRTMLAARRAESAIGELQGAIRSVSEHHSGEARWVEAPPPGQEGRGWVSAQSSPVDVSGKLSRNLWHQTDPFTEEERALGVACVSATMPTGFPMQAGLATQTLEVPSPFDDAFARSALFIPNGIPAIRALTSDGYNGPRFDVKKHQDYAAATLVKLVRANDGSALILAATANAGRAYAETLRRHLPNLRVLSQWDGGTPASLLHEWREDHQAVLVGTRSLMTGVDAPGETCSLVVLDRIPRRPSNPIDDARVEAIVARGAMDKWAADRLVYAADAALLEAQAVGRLIRSASDSGLVAVLDPRLLKYTRGQFPGYPEPTRQIYMKPLYHFAYRITDADEASDWMRARKRSAVTA